MKKLYALMLSVMVALLVAGSFSSSYAQSYTLADMTVRTIPNNFQEISGTEITNLRSQYGYYIGPSGSTITSPFQIRLNNFTTNQMRVSGNGTCYLWAATGGPAGMIHTANLYVYSEQYATYNYAYGYNYTNGSTQGPYFTEYTAFWNYPGTATYTGTGAYGRTYAYAPYITAIGYPTTFNGSPTNVQYTTLGSAPNRQFVVQMLYRIGYPYSYNYNGFTGQYTPANSVGSWQVVFHETPTNIPTKVQYFYRLDRDEYSSTVGHFGSMSYYLYPYSQWYGYSYDYWFSYTYGPGVGIRTDGTTGGNGYLNMDLTNPPANSVLTDNVHYSRTTRYRNVPTRLPNVGYEIAYYYPYDMTFGVGTELPFNNAVRSINIAFDPQIKLKNNGKNAYSSAQLRCKIDLVGGGTVYDQLLNVSGSQMGTIFGGVATSFSTFPSFTPNQFGIYNVTWTIVTASPTWPDNYTANDVYTSTFTVSPDNDLRSVAITTPANLSRTPVNIGMPLAARFHNAGVLNQPSGRVTIVVKNPSDVVVYRDTVTLNTWISGEYRDTTFRDFTPTSLGEHTIYAITILTNDQLRLNDTISSKVLVRYEADVRAVAVINPEDDGEKPEGKSFQPIGLFESVGVRDLFDIRARVQIRKCSDNSLVYQADSIPGIPELNIDEGQKPFSFPAKQGIYDIKNIPAGCYKICVISLLPDDGDRTNDTACTFFSFIPKLKGNIEVGVGRRFKTISAAVDSMRYRGIGGHLNLILTDANYSENGMTSVSSSTAAVDFFGIEGAGPNSIITWKPKANVFPTVTFTGTKQYCFNMGYNSTNWMRFDGNNQTFVTPDAITPEPGKRGLTIINNSVVPGAIFNLEHGRQNMAFRNMKLQGNGNLCNSGSAIFRTTNVYDNTSFLINNVRDTASNSYLTIDNNEMGNAYVGITSVGTIPLFNIGKAIFEDRRNTGNRITRNMIGTSSRPIGSVGIFFANEDGLLIQRNEISNVNGSGCTPDAAAIMSTPNPLGTGNSVNVLIDGNKIHNVGGASNVWGITVNQPSTIYTVGSGPNAKKSVLPVQTKNRVINNFLYDLRNGSGSINPISFNTTSATYTTENDSIYHNSLALNNSGSLITITRSAKPFLMNNIIANNNASMNTNAVLYTLSVPRPWQQNIMSDYNLGMLPNSNRVAVVSEYDRTTGTSIQTRTIVSLNDWRTLTGQDINSVYGDARFTSDSLHLPEATSYIFSPASNAGKWISATSRQDIDGDERLLANGTPDIGADEFEGFQWTNDLGVQVILQPSGLTNGSGAIVVTEDNPLNIQSIVKNLGGLQALDRKVWAKIDTSRSNGATWMNIYTSTPNEYDFDVAQSHVVDFAGANVVPQPNTWYRVTVWVGNDQNNANNVLTKTFTLTLKREAVLVSYESTTAKGLQNKDSVTRALRRLGVKFDSLDRASYGSNFIDYSPWWTLIWSTGNPTTAYNNTTAPGTPLGVGAVSLKETEEIVNFLRAGENYAKKSFVIAGQNIAQYNDPSSPFAQLNNVITDREFMDEWMHTRYKAQHPGLNYPTGTPTLHRGLLKGTGVYFIFNDSISAASPDVIVTYPVTGPVGTHVSRYAYNFNTHPATPLDSGAGTAWTSPDFNVVFYSFDLADALPTAGSTEAGTLTSGTTRFMRGALDFIQSFKGTVLPVEFAKVNGKATDNGNEITWQVASQKDVDRYEVEVLNGDNWNFVGDVKASSTKNYSFVDNSASAFEVKNFTYRVTSVDLDGARGSSPAVTFGRSADGLSLSLEQNFPNPFTGSTKINYTLPENGTVSIRIMDMTGKAVENLVAGQELTAGPQSVTFSNVNLATGNYVYELSFTNAAGETQRMTKMMTLTK
jgi:hypothetical protein